MNRKKSPTHRRASTAAARDADDWPHCAGDSADCGGVCCVLSLGGAAYVWADWYYGLPADAEATFVGRQSCVAVPSSRSTTPWHGSHHDLAMDLATDKTVLGDFNDAELTHHGITSRMFRRDGKFFVNTEGPDGKLADFEVKYVFGVDPLQQYMVEFDRPADMPANEVARLQVLRISWDTRNKKLVPSRPARREGEARPDRRAALDRPGPALEPHVRRLPLDESAEELRRRAAARTTRRCPRST